MHGSGQLRKGGLVRTAFKYRGPTAKSNLASFKFLTMYISKERLIYIGKTAAAVVAAAVA